MIYICTILINPKNVVAAVVCGSTKEGHYLSIVLTTGHQVILDRPTLARYGTNAFKAQRLMAEAMDRANNPQPTEEANNESDRV